MAAGRLAEAARIWGDVLAISPEHAQAHFHLGQHAVYLKQFGKARSLLERAAQFAPDDPAIPHSLSFIFRVQGDKDAEMAALARALAIDAYFFPALLSKAMLLERTGQKKAAAQVYKDALTISPPDEQLTPAIRQSLQHGRELARENSAALDAHLDVRLASARTRHPGANLERLEECKSVLAGSRKVYTQQPSMLHFPRLPALQFYDNKDFPWIEKLESATDAMRQEFLRVFREDNGNFSPYVSHPAGTPLNQWAELNHSSRWSALYLWRDGNSVAENCARCPDTAAAVQAAPMLELPRLGPTALFSLLAPHTRIPAHTGSTNVRLVLHLPLIVPPGCGFRVGNETREWEEGKAWVFDDTIEHEAWNGSDKLRVILIMDIWNPHLTLAERDLVSELLTGLREFNGE
jgi:aspartyl/asparaginyl beta-hydroxylase (cupin superfamily)